MEIPTFIYVMLLFAIGCMYILMLFSARSAFRKWDRGGPAGNSDHSGKSANSEIKSLPPQGGNRLRNKQPESTA